MNSDLAPPLVSCDWLAQHLDAEGVVILDASFFLPNQQRNAAEEHRQTHIPGALFFDIDAVADHSSQLPHMLQSPENFAAEAGTLGIDRHSHVVVYDSNFFMASARVWWTFRVFGHDRVSVLDGGLARWLAESRRVVSEVVAVEPAVYSVDYRPHLVRDLPEIQAALAEPAIQILDARSPGRFAGTEPEPRAGLRSGHIPGSVNVFFKDLIDDTTRRLKPAEALETCFRESGVNFSKSLVTSCGTGVTAAILALGLYVTGRRDVAVYDGSWTEWGGRDDTPVSTA
ncbi:MAG: mercaptopyruvate sulfurtransferase [Proteobacteria bacterium]|nr:mercaptopyruvate sulfurtransferase [Pseudomonadota bacterium]